ncbi:type 1 glutamine amidotransferase domain-containing protein [[Mycobacterium] vasticus]|uniref:Type 1 glutamine amidotransferase domain-containing protein n=1 Tax=[Mycobacterium] vasticus TaxID=2875777 RepID=A0ABU5YWG8_9MYCO|nr:type 1 glutamine amidotransferase domain-containing protein [Mycolicibacter sp. MYC017]MEB3069486.1 type 1 glutamine amidotransferase domain-containing protein [Mycolicibacter sp. MYC017]
MTKRILSVVSNVSHYADPSEPTGLWLSELTHAYDVFAQAGYQQTLVSPKGGLSPLEPRSLKFPSYDNNTKLSDGSLLVAGRRLTGFSWSEEILARVDKLVPYNVEAQMKQRGARYTKGLIPFGSHVVVDGRLVTGQNPGSAKATAKNVVAVLGK